jgi:hypothetical protein
MGTMQQESNFVERGKETESCVTYCVPYRELESSSLNFIFTHSKDLIPLWVEFILDDFALCFHSSHCQPHILLLPQNRCPTNKHQQPICQLFSNSLITNNNNKNPLRNYLIEAVSFESNGF